MLTVSRPTETDAFLSAAPVVLTYAPDDRGSGPTATGATSPQDFGALKTMTYATQLHITANTAIDTAAICYRKARRDVHRIHGLLTHPRTVEAAKIAIWSLYVGAVVAYALGQSARILLQSWVDAQVSSALVEASTAHLPAAEEMVDAPAEMTGAEVVQAEIEAAFLEEMIAAVEETEQSTEGQPDYSTLTTPELRRECAAVGIRWKNARGKNHHMTKAQMVDALEGHHHAA